MRKPAVLALPAALARLAFSLVELSIVLVILGLLVGGVLAGQSLIHASELRAVTAEYGEIITATNSFKSKYFALPGDFNSATRFWQTEYFQGAPSYQTNCISNSGTAINANALQGACDGNGDGKIDTASGNWPSEDAQFWQHLKMAGLYSRIPTSSYGVNVLGYASSRLPNAVWMALYSPPTSGSFTYFSGNTGSPGNIIELGGYAGNSLDASKGAMLPEDAYRIDMKMDDGKPLTGTVRTNNFGTSYFADCIAGSDYNMPLTYKDCSVAFLNPF